MAGCPTVISTPYFNTFLNSFLAFCSGLLLNRVLDHFRESKQIINKKKLFLKEITFNINQIKRSITNLMNYKDALITRIDLNNSYDCKITASVSVYRNFINDGFIFDLLQNDDILTLEGIFENITTLNNQVTPAINEITQNHINSKIYTIDNKEPSFFTDQQNILNIIGTLQTDKIKLSALSEKIKKIAYKNKFIFFKK